MIDPWALLGVIRAQNWASLLSTIKCDLKTKSNKNKGEREEQGLLFRGASVTRGKYYPYVHRKARHSTLHMNEIGHLVSTDMNVLLHF